MSALKYHDYDKSYMRIAYKSHLNESNPSFLMKMFLMSMLLAVTLAAPIDLVRQSTVSTIAEEFTAVNQHDQESATSALEETTTAFGNENLVTVEVR